MPDHERQKSGLIWSDDSWDGYRAPFYDHDWDDTMELAMLYPSGIDENGQGLWRKEKNFSYSDSCGQLIPAKVMKEVFTCGPNHVRIALRKSIEQDKPIEDWDHFLKSGALELATPEYQGACYDKWGIFCGIQDPNVTHLQWDD